MPNSKFETNRVCADVIASCVYELDYSQHVNYLVTGADGFIGFNFINELLDSESLGSTKVYALDNFSLNRQNLNLRNYANNSNFELVEADILDFDTLRDVISKVDYVVNFAAESHVDNSIANPLRFFNSNILGVSTILEAIRDCSSRPRLLQVSTDEVYGSLVSGLADENHRLFPNSPYSSSKASADLICRSYVETYKLDVVVSRSCNNYGPYQNPEKVIPNFISKALKGQPLEIYGNGKNIREWIHVSDNCKALRMILESGRTGEIYNIGTGFAINNTELAKKVLTALDISTDCISYIQDRRAHDFRYSVDSHKISEELGFLPTVEFDMGLKNTIAWYQTNSNWLDEAIKI